MALFQLMYMIKIKEMADKTLQDHVHTASADQD
jgi:hypothetical protein